MVRALDCGDIWRKADIYQHAKGAKARGQPPPELSAYVAMAPPIKPSALAPALDVWRHGCCTARYSLLAALLYVSRVGGAWPWRYA